MLFRSREEIEDYISKMYVNINPTWLLPEEFRQGAVSAWYSGVRHEQDVRAHALTHAMYLAIDRVMAVIK